MAATRGQKETPFTVGTLRTDTHDLRFLLAWHDLDAYSALLFLPMAVLGPWRAPRADSIRRLIANGRILCSHKNRRYAVAQPAVIGRLYGTIGNTFSTTESNETMTMSKETSTYRAFGIPEQARVSRRQGRRRACCPENRLAALQRIFGRCFGPISSGKTP